MLSRDRGMHRRRRDASVVNAIDKFHTARTRAKRSSQLYTIRLYTVPYVCHCRSRRTRLREHKRQKSLFLLPPPPYPGNRSRVIMHFTFNDSSLLFPGISSDESPQTARRELDAKRLERFVRPRVRGQNAERKRTTREDSAEIILSAGILDVYLLYLRRFQLRTRDFILRIRKIRRS